MKSANPKQGEMFSGEELKEAGIAEVLGHTKTSWFFAMLHTAEELLRTVGEFTADDLIAVVGKPPNNHNAIGATVNHIVTMLHLRSHGRRKSTRPEGHARKMEVWGR